MLPPRTMPFCCKFESFEILAVGFGTEGTVTIFGVSALPPRTNVNAALFVGAANNDGGLLHVRHSTSLLARKNKSKEIPISRFIFFR